MASEQATLYSQIAKLQLGQGLELVDFARKLKHAQEPINILDFGCGTAPLATPLLDLAGGGRVFCMDPDEARLGVAQKQHEEDIRHGKLVIVRADDASMVQALVDIAPGQKFGMIIVNFVLHWVKQKADLFAAFAKVLNLGGFVLVQSPEYLVPLHRQVTELMSEQDRQNKILERFHMTRGIEEVVDATLESKAFTVVSSFQVPVQIAYPSLDAYLEWWSATTHGAFSTSAIPASSLTLLREEHRGECVVEEPTFRVIFQKSSDVPVMHEAMNEAMGLPISDL